MLAWGLGDFLIQKSTRRMGTISQKLSSLFFSRNDEKYSIWIVLFYICGFGAIVLTPFVWNEIGLLGAGEIWLLFLIGLVMLAAALLDFEALKIGKISVVEPVFALEIPAVMVLTSLFLSEVLTIRQYFLIFVLVVGIIFISIRDFGRLKRFVFERGVGLAVAATIGMGLADFLVGFGSRAISPLMTNWFLNIFITTVTLGYLASAGKLKVTWDYARENRKLIFNTCFFDNLAWVTYAYSMVLIPITIATAISESYIAIGAILGFVYNKEKLARHQWAGLVLTMMAAIILAVRAGG